MKMKDFECSGNGWKVRVQVSREDHLITLYIEDVNGNSTTADVHAWFDCDESVRDGVRNAKALARAICGLAVTA